MKLMTIFQLAAMTESEREMLARLATEQADNTTLRNVDGIAAAPTLANLRQLRAPKF